MLKLLKFLKGSAILYAILAPLFMMLEVAMDLTLPTMLSNIVDIGIANGDIHYVLATGVKMMLYAFIGLLGGVGCSIFSTMAAVNLGQSLRDGLFAKIQSLSFLELDHFKTPSLITRLTNDGDDGTSSFSACAITVCGWIIYGVSVESPIIDYLCRCHPNYFNLCWSCHG